MRDDRQELVQRLEQSVALAAEVRDVEARPTRERDQLVCLRVKRGSVDQCGREANGTFVHRLGDKLLHAPELRLARRPVGGAELVLAHRRRADEGRDVRRDAAPLEVLEILAERRPLDRVPEQRLSGDLFLHLVRERPHREALAHHLERHALPNIALSAPVLEQRLGRPAEHVDEPGCDGEPTGVELLRPRQSLSSPTSAIVSPAIATSPSTGAPPRPS